MKKVIMLCLMTCLMAMVSFGQKKVEKNEEFKTTLKTFKVEFVNGYYSNNLGEGYRYPAIRKGFYTVGFFLRYDDLIKLYEELINISKGEDGAEYILSVKMKNIKGVKKKGNKIQFKCLWYGSTNHNAYYSYTKKVKTKHLESDLQIIKEEFLNYNNK